MFILTGISKHRKRCVVSIEYVEANVSSFKEHEMIHRFVIDKERERFARNTLRSIAIVLYERWITFFIFIKYTEHGKILKHKIFNLCIRIFLYSIYIEYMKILSEKNDNKSFLNMQSIPKSAHFFVMQILGTF